MEYSMNMKDKMEDAILSSGYSCNILYKSFWERTVLDKLNLVCVLNYNSYLTITRSM